MKWFLGGMILLWLGCAKHSAPLTEPEIQSEVERGMGSQSPIGLASEISDYGQRTGWFGHNPGAMILHQPNRARLDIMTPLQAPMMLMASNGTALHMWLHRDGLFFAW